MGRLRSALLGIGAAALAACSESSTAADDFEKKASLAANAFPAPLVGQRELRENLDGYLLVDVRSVEEFAVSRIPGATNWPDYKGGSLPAAVVSGAAKGKSVVLYCSIGYRSGEAAVRAAELLGGDVAVFNLRGGIFQWANEGGPLEGSQRVHGYDAEWSMLLDPARRYLPENGTR